MPLVSAEINDRIATQRYLTPEVPIGSPVMSRTTSETSVGLTGQQKLYVRRSHMRPEPHHDELHTFRRENEPRRHCRNEGWIRAVAESHCRHDMMMSEPSGGRSRKMVAIVAGCRSFRTFRDCHTSIAFTTVGAQPNLALIFG